MIRDPMLLVNIQLAILGIVVVAGLFYLWRMICRVEKRVDDFINTQQMAMASQQCQHIGGAGAVDVDAETEAFMQEVFGVAPILINTPVATPQTSPSIQITEDDSPQTDNDAQSVGTTSTVPSKNKLKRMPVEQLRDICKEKGLSPEGTKTVLMDRIASTMEDEE